jgi:predicted AAA+ superfamily ATPase
MKSTEIIKAQLREILQEWHEFELPDLVPRRVDTAPLLRNRIVSVIGPRRAGKTWFCFQLMKELLAKGVPRENLIYINFEDERLAPLGGAELTYLLEAHGELTAIRKSSDLWCFVDEIQNVPNWSKWVRRVTDQNRALRIVLTGSSSKLLSREIATELRGRTVSTTILPYSFAEFLGAHGRPISDADESLLHSPKRSDIKRLYRLYALKGGFPGIPDENYREVLQEYYRVMFSRDIIERFAVKNVRLLEDFLKVQLSRFASLSSVSKLEKELAVLGYRLSKNTLNAYLGYAKDVFLLFEAPIFSPKVKNQLLYPRKVYGVDQGLLNAIRFSLSEDRGRILENMVYLELKRREKEIFYFANQAECDFVLVEGRKAAYALQVCFSMEGGAREREIRGLTEAMDSFGLQSGLILTDDETGEVKVGSKRILLRPFWFFALQESIEPPAR